VHAAKALLFISSLKKKIWGGGGVGIYDSEDRRIYSNLS
jgi:hypothetical protein